MVKDSQCEQILRYMEAYGSITAAEAMEHIGCYRLAARIADLRKAGHTIESEMDTGKNRHKKAVNYAVYRLIRKAPIKVTVRKKEEQVC